MMQPMCRCFEQHPDTGKYCEREHGHDGDHRFPEPYTGERIPWPPGRE